MKHFIVYSIFYIIFLACASSQMIKPVEVNGASKSNSQGYTVLDMSGIGTTPLSSLERLSVQLDPKGTIHRFTTDIVKENGYFYGVDEDDSTAISMIERARDGKTYYTGSMNDGTTITRIESDQDGNTVILQRLGKDYPPELDPNDLISEEKKEEEEEGEQERKLEFTSFNNNPVTTIIDVMVVWTLNSECTYSFLPVRCTPTSVTEQKMRDLIDLAFFETNTAYQLSGVDTRIRLVHAYRDSNYNEPNNNLGAILNDVAGMFDGRMDDVHSKRAQYGADMVSVISNSGDYCGIAYLGPRTDIMFSITAFNCATGNYSFGHELGHNMGCNHDKGTMGACSFSAYNYGYRNPQAQFRTVMAYTCTIGQCDQNAGGGCNRILRFSTPNTQYAYNGLVVGTNGANNARQINEVSATIAAYYSAGSSTPQPTPSPTPAPTPAPTPQPTPATGSCLNHSNCNDNDSCTSDNCVSGTCVYALSCAACSQSTVSVQIITDQYPAETSWTVYNSNRAVLRQGSGYSVQFSTYTLSFCLASGSYSFEIEDTFGDGICCAEGSGSYTVRVENSVVASGGEFETVETVNFNVGGSSTTPYPTQRQPTPYPTERNPTPLPTPSAIVPTPHPTERNPTPYPTEKAPVSSPFASPVNNNCSGKREFCFSHSDCCVGKCNFKRLWCKKGP